MAIRSLTEAQRVQELTEAADSASRFKKEMFERHPNLALEGNWPVIVGFIGKAELNTENIEQAITILSSQHQLAILSDVDLAADQQQMADTICATQFQRKFKPSESESWSKKLYEMAWDRRHRYLVQLSRVQLKELVGREAGRPVILAAKKASRPAYNPSVILGGRAAYDQTLADELETFASMDIEELEKVGAELRAVDTLKNSNTATLRAEVKADYESRHPEAVGASPVRPEDVKRFNQRSEQVENRDNPNGVVISFTAQELKSMPLEEYRRLFMRNNGGSWTYRPGVEAAINAILSGQLTEPARIRSEFQRTHIVA